MRYFVILAALTFAIFGSLSRYADRVTQAPAAAPVLASASVTPTVSSGRRSVSIPRDSRGHFQVDGRVDGRRVEFMVDTGASVIALTAREARRLGISPSRSDYTVTVRTANGDARAAPVRLSMVDIGGLVVRDVQALVATDEALSENLLGLSYLTKLKRFEYANGKLVLEQ